MSSHNMDYIDTATDMRQWQDHNPQPVVEPEPP